ncbi:MAG TPA: exo-alpha-sialidase, partial [Planctomycetes bacterium]|nr:exo-alpha-sialidase [Planctomycetota bacterium]
VRPGKITFAGQWTVGEGPDHLWISVTPKADVDIDGRVDGGLVSLTLASGEQLKPTVSHPPNSQRLGIALRNKNSDEVPTYRIPGLVTSNAGTLLCVYDQRHEGWRDLPGDIDVGLSRSTDGGRSWEPMRTILDMGNDPAFSYDGVGDPAILVDRKTGTIWVAASWHHGALGWNGSGPGFEPHETGQLMLVRSDDDGINWSAPINITRQVKDSRWCFLLQGPGRGITMQDGTLVFPAQYQLDAEHGREPRSTVLWSKDHGTTWHLGHEARSNTTEAAVVELETGRLMLNMRDNRGRKPPGWRAVSTSKNLGATWVTHKPSVELLKEPVCMASLIHVGRELTGKADGQLLFSNPAVGRAPRRRLTLQLSLDMGQTWSQKNALLLDEGGSAGYSCLTMIDAHTIGIVYECSRSHLAFQRIALDEIKSQHR